MQDVKEQRLKDLGRIAPASKVEGLETAEGERVLGVVEEESVLALPRPAMQPIFQLAEDVGEVRDRALLRLENINPLDSIPELSLLPVIEPIAAHRCLRSESGRTRTGIADSLLSVEARTD